MSGTRIPPELAGEIATLARDVTAPLPGFTLNPRDDILATRGGRDGLKIYQDLSRDGHTGAVLRKRRAAVVSRAWSVEPGGERPEDLVAAALVRAALARINFDRACQGLLGSILTGKAVAEVQWEAAPLDLAPEDGPARSGTFIVPSELRVRNPRRFTFDRDEQLRLLTWDAPMDGMLLPERKFILARFWAEENDDPHGRGLGHDLFWPVFFKRNGIALWNALLERFGQPFVYAEYPAGTPANERAELVRAIADIGRGAAAAVPQGTLIKFLEAGQQGATTGNPQAALVAVMNAEISKIVLGETQTTEQGANGARASAEVHDDVRVELADADADLLSQQLAPLCEWITEINLPGARPPMVWRRRKEEPDLVARAKLDESLFKVGFEPTEEYVAETYGPHYRRISRPASGGPPIPPGEDEAEFAEGPEDPVNAIAERLGRDAEGAQQELLDAIRSEVEQAASFAELEQRLTRLSGALPVQPIAEKLGPAFVLAYLSAAKSVDDRR
jgi:phage gp29-like protein